MALTPARWEPENPLSVNHFLTIPVSRSATSLGSSAFEMVASENLLL
jgi:hypothetical protein